jgi:hypothetical protein
MAAILGEIGDSMDWGTLSSLIVIALSVQIHTRVQRAVVMAEPYEVNLLCSRNIA